MLYNKIASSSLFKLKLVYFDSPSNLHGLLHTYRVMCHIIYIGHGKLSPKEINMGLCAAFIHDMARKNDGYCTEHGLWAADTKLPKFEELFQLAGLKPYDYNIIKEAVTNHSQLIELSVKHPAYMVTALLKDADALDRIRLGDHNLKPEFLRFEKSHQLIPFAFELFYRTDKQKFHSFTEVLNVAELINQQS